MVRAHPLWQPDLALQSPRGHRIGDINVTTASGIWQSATRLINGIANDTERTARNIFARQARIATINQELVRLATGDGQASYDAAVAELAAITTAFAVADEAAQAEAPTADAGPTADAHGTGATATLHAATIAAVLALKRADEAGPALTVTLPPARASLAWMEAQAQGAERLEDTLAPESPTETAENDEPAARSFRIAVQRGQRTPTLQFGTALAKRRALSPPHAAPAGEEAFDQITLL